MTQSIDIDSLDRLISNAGLGSFELNTDLSIRTTLKAKPKPTHHTPRVSQDFLLDLDLAGRSVMAAISELVQSDRGIANLMVALDGIPAAERSHDTREALTELLLGFVTPRFAPRFLPAVNTTAPHMVGGVHSLPHGCASAIDTDLTRVYCAAHLGFRDLFQAAQTATVKSLILRVEPLGILTDPVEAFVALSRLLGTSDADARQDAAMDVIRMGSPVGEIEAYATSFHRDT